MEQLRTHSGFLNQGGWFEASRLFGAWLEEHEPLFAQTEPIAKTAVVMPAWESITDLVREGRDGFILPIRDVDAIKEKILYFYEKGIKCLTTKE